MPLTTYDLPTLQAQVLAYFRAQFPNQDTSAASYLGQLANVIAMSLLEAQNELLQVDQDWPPSGSSYTPGRQSSSAALDQAASLLGLPNGLGGFGRRAATISSGGTGQLLAPSLTLYPSGLILVDQTGQIQVQLDGSVTIPPLAISDFGSFISITTGIAANLPAGSILTFQSPPPGAAPTVTLISALTGALNQETDDQLLARIFEHLQNWPSGGKSIDWRDWLANIQAIKQVFVFPKRSGTGTVDVLIAAGGAGTSGRGRIPGSDTQVEALAALNANRPVCSQPNLLTPFFYLGRELTIRSLAYPSLSKYAWDWTSGTGLNGYTVTAFTPGSPAVLQFNGDIATLSPTFKAKIDAGSKPRIIVATTTGPVVPLMVAVTAYQVVAGPKTNLTLDTLPAGWVDPIAGDYIFPGGPIAYNQLNPLVGPVQRSAAQRISDYIDVLGPSRQSGFADDSFYWEDTVYISVLKQMIIDQTDLDGTKMVRSTGNSPLSDTTIQVGSTGIPAALDFVALDGIPNQPPEMILARWIIVTGP